MDSNSQLIPPSPSDSKESTKSSSHHSGLHDARRKTRAIRRDIEEVKDRKTTVRESIAQVVVVLFFLAFLGCMVIACFLVVQVILQQYWSSQSELEFNHLVHTTSKSVLRLKQQAPLRCEKPSVICDPMPVLCTVGADTLSEWIVLPPIGYCSITFFEALGYQGHNKLGEETSPRLSNFMQRVGERAGSEFGVAFDFEYAKVARHVLSSPNGTEALAPFQQQGIFHFGVLNAETSQSSADVNLKVALDVFKAADIHKSAVKEHFATKQFQRARDADAPYLQGGIVFGIRMTSRQTVPEIGLINEIVMEFKVDMLVATTHLRETHGQDIPCRILAPTTWDHKFSRFEHPIRDVVELLSDRGYLDLGIPVSISFSLKGFWYAPMHPEQDSDFAPGRPCTVNSAAYLGSYAKVCNDPAYRDYLTAFDDGHFVNYTFNKKKKLTFTFDSLQTITKKAVLAHHLDRRVSFAVFDVDFGDVHEECPGSVYGAFDRVAGVRWLTDRFKQLLLSADEETTDPAG